MTELLTEIFAFPTAVFTILLGVVTAYWLFVIAGALHLDVLDGLHGATNAADAASGTALDAASAHGHHVLDGDFSVLDALGMRGVPLTVWLSGFVLFAWTLTLVGMQTAGAPLASLVGPFISGALVSTVAMAASAAITSFAVRPFRRLGKTPTAIANKSLVGRTCTVTTMRVDGHFGQAEIADGGAGLLVQVRCDEPNDLTRGSEALIFQYDAADGVFHVARFDDAVDARAVERRLRTPE